jgi:hypothetical protein
MGEWHCVRTRPGAEERAHIGIQAAGMETFLPVELVRANYRGNRPGDRAVMWRPLFMGHLFAMLDSSKDLPKLREIHGVDDVVRRDGRLAPIADDAIAAIRRAERSGLFDAAVGCRPANDESPPRDGRHADLVKKIKSARWSKKRTQLLMSLLVSR